MKVSARCAGGLRTAGALVPSLFGLGLCLLVSAGFAQKDEPIDFDKARQLRQRVLKGETLAPEERVYLERAKAAFRKRQGATKTEAGQASERESSGLAPLTELSAEGGYKGQDGGLYGEGQNEPPEAIRVAAQRIAGQIQPLDRQGTPSPDGKIGLISVGMSNTTQEFRRFMALANADPEKSPDVVIVDGAQGGMDALTWASPEQAVRPGRPDPWTVLDARLKQAGIAPSRCKSPGSSRRGPTRLLWANSRSMPMRWRRTCPSSFAS